MSKMTLDFLVVGAQKAGTTSLHEYLRCHPNMHLPRGKEVPYFSHDSMMEKGWQAYLKTTFGDADPRQLWGTVSPSYLVGAPYESRKGAGYSGRGDETTVPRRIADVMPGVRLIAILRDPVERALSHHRMLAMDGREQRTFDHAIEELLYPDALVHARRSPMETNGYVTWGEYGRLLSGYLRVFPRHRLLILFFDDLAARPLDVLQRVYEFLELDMFIPENLGVRYRTGAARRRIGWLRPGELRRSVAQNASARSAWRRLPAGARARFDRSFDGAAYRFDLWNRSEVGGASAMSTETRSRLEQHFSADLMRLRMQFGINPPWRSEGSG